MENEQKIESIKKEDRINNVLFVDSDKSLVAELKDWIKKAEIESQYNLRFTFVGNVKEALKKLAEMSVTMLVLEIVLPITSGYNLIRAVKKEYENMPIIIYTRLKNPQDLAKMASTKVNNIFLKELMNIQDLVEIIQKKESAENIDAIVMELGSQIKALHSQEGGKELKLIQCPECRIILAPDSHFCNNCGQKIVRKTKKILSQAEGAKTEEAPVLQEKTEEVKPLPTEPETEDLKKIEAQATA